MTDPNERSPLRTIAVHPERPRQATFDGPFSEFMSRCPKDVSEYMLSFLDARSLCTLSEAVTPALNRSVRSVPAHVSLLHALTSDRVWKPLVARDFKDHSGEAIEHGATKTQYLRLRREEIERQQAEYLRLHPPVTFRDGCSAGFHFYQEVLMPCVVGPMFLIFFALLASRLESDHVISISTFIPLLIFAGVMGMSHLGFFYVASFRHPFPFRDDTLQESRSILKFVHQAFGQHPVIAVLYSLSSLVSLVWFVLIALFLSNEVDMSWDTVFIPSWISSGLSGFMQVYVAIRMQRSLPRLCNAVTTVALSVVWMWYLLQKLNGNKDFLIALWLIPLWIPSLAAVCVMIFALCSRKPEHFLTSLFIPIPIVVFFILLSIRDAGGDISYKELFAPLFVPLSLIAIASWILALYAFKKRFIDHNAAPVFHAEENEAHDMDV